MIEVWHKGHPGLALVDGELVFVSDDVLREVYDLVLDMSDREASKAGEIDWAGLERRLFSRLLARGARARHAARTERLMNDPEVQGVLDEVFGREAMSHNTGTARHRMSQDTGTARHWGQDT
mgnify:CR=1 FL=1